MRCKIPQDDPWTLLQEAWRSWILSTFYFHGNSRENKQWKKQVWRIWKTANFTKKKLPKRLHLANVIKSRVKLWNEEFERFSFIIFYQEEPYILKVANIQSILSFLQLYEYSTENGNQIYLLSCSGESSFPLSLSMSFYPDFVSTFAWFYPNFIQLRSG